MGKLGKPWGNWEKLGKSLGKIGTTTGKAWGNNGKTTVAMGKPLGFVEPFARSGRSAINTLRA